MSSCTDCGRALPEDAKYPECFKCRVGTISVSYPYGRAQFHGPTIKERLEREWKSVAKAAKKGNHFEPIPVRSQNF